MEPVAHAPSDEKPFSTPDYQTQLSTLRALGHKGVFVGLEAIILRGTVERITFESDEVTAICPVTGQPDWYKVHIEIFSTNKSIESKSLKLYLQSFKDIGMFAEDLAITIKEDITRTLEPFPLVSVEITQKARGGITLTALADND